MDYTVSGPAEDPASEGTATGSVSSTATPPPGDVWEQIGRELTEFGGRVAEVARSAVDDPETRRHAREVQVKLGALADSIGDAVDRAAGSPEAQSVKERASEAAEAVSSAAGKAADEVAPHVATALRAANEALRSAVEHLEGRASRGESPAADEGDADGPSDEVADDPSVSGDAADSADAPVTDA